MASLMQTIIGHDEQRQQLLTAFQNDSLPHALVFSGPTGIGKMKLALALAQVLVCEEKNSTNNSTKSNRSMACGICGSCVRVAKNQSENVRVISPSGSQIKIDQVRQILDFLSLANDQQKRVIIIDQAQALNAQASNALLKTLEEPPPDVYFILIAVDVRLLMPTIRSRSQIMSFKTLTDEQLRLILPGLADWIYRSARGQAHLLAEFSTAESRERRDLDLKFYELFWTQKSFLQATDIKEYAKDRQSALQVLKNWFVFSRDLLFLGQNERDRILNSDQITALTQLDFISSQRLFDFSQALLQAMSDADKLDITLLFESLWVKYARSTH